MILTSLVSYYEALLEKGELSRPGWDRVSVGYGVLLRPDGSIRSVVSLKKEEMRGKKSVLVPIELRAPKQFVRTSGIRANFLCDTPAYLLGYSEKDPKESQKFEASKELHLRVLANADSDAARTLKNYFLSHQPGGAEALGIPQEYAEDFSNGVQLTFLDEDGRYLMGDAAVAAAWDSDFADDGDTVKGRCIVTGREDRIAVLHSKIKGVPGAQSSGAALVSFNAPAFESYGNDGGQGLNAKVGKYAMNAYSAALNHLLAGNNRTQIGDTTIVWWTPDADKECEDFFAKCLSGEDEGTALGSIMRRISHGDAMDFSAARLEKPFCILGLSPNAARLSARFFYRDTFGTFLEHIAAHYERLNIEKSEKARKYLTPRYLLLETVPPDVKNPDNAISPLLGGALLSAILNDWRYPESLYDSVLCRIRAKNELSPGKAAIIKAYLLKNTDNKSYKEVLTMSLNEESTNRAYVLGRLFAALENAQYNANNKSSNLKERYLTSACATPGLVFPAMIQMSVHHTEKSGSVQDAKLIAELMDKLEGGVPFPARLDNTEQGLFLEGYYHQTQKKFRDIAEAKKNKEAES